MDLYIVSGRDAREGHASLSAAQRRRRPPPRNHLFRNDGNGKFTDVTDAAGVGGDLFSMAAIAADYDNDGFVDLLVTGYGRAILYRNKGNGTFEDVTRQSRRPGPRLVDRRRLARLRPRRLRRRLHRPLREVRPGVSLLLRRRQLPRAARLCAARPTCCCTTTATARSPTPARPPESPRVKGRAMGVTAADFDLDGYPDIYVANDKSENFLFHNKGNGTFEEIALAAGVAYGQNGENTSAMGPVFQDFDQDGRVDLWVSDSKYNRLLKNTGKLQFEDVTQKAGIAQLSAQYVSWGTGVHDFDNDGRDDLFVVHGGLVHLVPQEHSVFRNAGRREVRGCLVGRRAPSSSRRASDAARRSPTMTTMAGWIASS